jgi:MoaA/NifB/PqqE/SkfB family radical SAM enzyme
MNDNGVFDKRNQRFFEQAFTMAQARAKQGLRGAVAAATELAGIAGFQRIQAAKRTAAAKAGKTVPGILISSVTRDCNLDCTGCYSKTLRPGASAELPDERFLQLFEEAVHLGVGTLMIAGGEPLLRRSLLQQLAGMNGPIIPVFTNGTLFDEAYLDLFAGSRMVPIFSVEGDAAFTAR